MRAFSVRLYKNAEFVYLCPYALTAIAHELRVTGHGPRTMAPGYIQIALFVEVKNGQKNTFSVDYSRCLFIIAQEARILEYISNHCNYLRSRAL
jgi:hypothetical protein